MKVQTSIKNCVCNIGLTAVWTGSLVVVSVLWPASTWALQYMQDPYSLTIEGFANLSGAYTSTDNGDDTTGRGFGELRLLALANTGYNLLIGPRITYRTFNGSEIEDGARIGEVTLIFLGTWGRLEIGERRGLPDVLTGYAPNNYQFVSSEYGPASGPSLDPDGGLQTSMLSSALSEQISALSGLGITAALFGDESAKVIYVLPKMHGFLGGVSYAPRVEGSEGQFRNLVQSGLTWERYWAQNVVRVGGTYTYADGQNTEGGALRTDDLHSFSLGTTATLDDALTVGASFTYNGDTGLTRVVAPAFESAAYGYAASVNYNHGPWTYGGFLQLARSAGDTATNGADELRALQVGASYRSSTYARYFTALYLYEFDDESGRGGLGTTDGVVALVGARLNF